MGDDDARYAEISAALADAVEVALPGWVERSVRVRLRESGRTMDDTLRDQARDAGAAAVAATMPGLRELLASDPDAQRSTPLTILRSAARFPTEVLRAAGVPPVRRDEFEERAQPEDVYGLAPASFADIDESLAEPGLVWGAAKAHLHLARRRLHDRPEPPSTGDA